MLRDKLVISLNNYMITDKDGYYGEIVTKNILNETQTTNYVEYDNNNIYLYVEFEDDIRYIPNDYKMIKEAIKEYRISYKEDEKLIINVTDYTFEDDNGRWILKDVLQDLQDKCTDYIEDDGTGRKLILCLEDGTDYIIDDYKTIKDTIYPYYKYATKVGDAA